MTLGQIATKARSLVNADTVSYTDANLLIDINLWYQKAALMAVDSGDDIDFDDARKTDYPIKTTPMRTNIRDYTIPVSEKVLKLKRCDISYDGVTAHRATPFDTGNYTGGLMFSNASSVDTAFDQNFSRLSPIYDAAYNTVFIAPMPVQADVDAGGFIRFEWERQVTNFTTSDYSSVLTDSTVVPGFDDPLHPLLSYGAAFEFATSKNLPQLASVSQQLQDYEQRLRTHYGRKDWDRQLVVGVDYTVSYK